MLKTELLPVAGDFVDSEQFQPSKEFQFLNFNNKIQSFVENLVFSHFK
jgi:hypothetical protein